MASNSFYRVLMGEEVFSGRSHRTPRVQRTEEAPAPTPTPPAPTPQNQANPWPVIPKALSREAYHMERRAKLLAEGRCTACGKPKGDSPYTTTCVACRRRAREAKRERMGSTPWFPGSRGRKPLDLPAEVEAKPREVKVEGIAHECPGSHCAICGWQKEAQGR
ncbi:MAG TPA: hypothetical protein VEI97_06315 [bacterium]|nr:hypothetical protein [bacterium]